MASRSVTARFLQIRLNGYKRKGDVAYQPVHEVVHTSLQHKQSSPQLQLLGATGWRPVPLYINLFCNCNAIAIAIAIAIAKCA